MHLRTASAAGLTGRVFDQHKLTGRRISGSTIRLAGGRFPASRADRTDDGRIAYASPVCAISSSAGNESMSAAMFNSTPACANARSINNRSSNERRGDPFHARLSGDAHSRFDRQCRRVERSGCGGLVLVSSAQRLAGHCTLDARAGAFLGVVDFAPPPTAPFLRRRRPSGGVRLVGVQIAFIQFSIDVTPRVIGEASCVAHDAAIADADAARRRSAWNKRRRERISSEKRPRRSHRPIERAEREFGGGVKRGKRKRPSTGAWLSKAVSPSGLSEARGWI